MDGKFLGVIKDAKFGIYDGDKFGLQLEFKYDEGSGVQWFIGIYTTEFDNAETVAHHFTKIYRVFADAKVGWVQALKGIPVEVTIESNMLKDWRILRECIL